jgi:hypothetical protein
MIVRVLTSFRTIVELVVTAPNAMRGFLLNSFFRGDITPRIAHYTPFGGPIVSRKPNFFCIEICAEWLTTVLERARFSAQPSQTGTQWPSSMK